LIASSVGVRTLQPGPAGLVRRLATGEPFGAICFGARACWGGALLWVWDVAL
jgi:hypothetical protein